MGCLVLAVGLDLRKLFCSAGCGEEMESILLRRSLLTVDSSSHFMISDLVISQATEILRVQSKRETLSKLHQAFASTRFVDPNPTESDLKRPLVYIGSAYVVGEDSPLADRIKACGPSRDRLLRFFSSDGYRSMSTTRELLRDGFDYIVYTTLTEAPKAVYRILASDGFDL